MAASGPAAAQTPPAAVPAAGQIPGAVALTLTGSRIGAHFIARQIDAALDRLIRPTLAPGGAIAYGKMLPAPQALPPSYITNVYVPVTISGIGLAPVTALTSVALTNMALVPQVPGTLVLDDDPEYVSQPGLLSSATVEPRDDARLYYYHEDAGQPMDVAVVLRAASPAASRVQLIDAEAGPDADVMSVGAAVSRTFLRDEPHDDGIVVDVTPGAPFVVRNSLLRSGELVAGSVDIRVLSGGPVTASVVALSAEEDPAANVSAPEVPRDGHHREGRFAIRAFGAETLAYTVGGRDVSYVYGGRDPTPPNVDPNGGHDYGDYGVLHDITFDADNPTGVPAPLYLYEEPRGGAVRSAFLVDGHLTVMGCARLPERYLIAAYRLPPSIQTAITILTTTDGGSNYPLEIGVTQTPPLPNTPPISAAGGCFPKAAPVQ